MQSKLTKNQKRKFTKLYTEDGDKYKIVATVRYDDECSNGHNTFAITGDIYRGRIWECGGCIHEEIAKHFPELEQYIKWHLVSSDGPMHYLANTLYNAGDKDYNGKRKGEPNHRHDKTKIFFNNVPIPYGNYKDEFLQFIQDVGHELLNVTEHNHKEPETYSPKYSFNGFPTGEWYKCPFDSKEEAENFLSALKTCKVEYKTVVTAWGKGKERELDAARNSAVWPNATDEQLCSDYLKDILIARLPKLLNEFKTAIETLEFIF